MSGAIYIYQVESVTSLAKSGSMSKGERYMVCPRCGSNNSDKTKKCIVCGMMFNNLSNMVNNNGAYKGYFSVAPDLGTNQFHNEQNDQKNDSLVQERNTMIYPGKYETDKYTSVKKDKRNKTVATSVISICLIAVVGVCLYLFVLNGKTGDAKDENTNNNSEMAEYDQVVDNGQEELVEDNENSVAQDVEENVRYRKSKVYIYDSNDNLVEQDYFKYDDYGNLVSRECEPLDDSDVIVKDEYEYDVHGNCISESSYTVGAESQQCEPVTHEYDEKNRLIKTTYSSGYYDTYEYDANDNMVKESTYLNDAIKLWCEYTYDENNNMIETVIYTKDLDGTFHESDTLIYTYSTYGNNTRKEISAYDEDGTVYIKDADEYDEYGNMTRMEQYNEGELQYCSSWEYEYDENGNVLVVKSYGSDGYSGKRVYEYETY